MSDLHTFNQLRYPISDEPTTEEFARLPPALYNEICDYLNITFVVSAAWLSTHINQVYTVRERREMVQGIRHKVCSYE